MARRSKFLLTLLLCLWSCVARSGQMTGAQIVGQNELVFRLSSTFKYHYFSLASPERLVIDFEQTGLRTNLNHVSLGRLPVRSIRTSVSADYTLRVVLDLSSTQKPLLKVLPPNGREPWRLSVIFNPKLAVASATKNSLASSPQLNAKANYKPRLVIIAIDAGHGGKDPGARGKYGTREKDVVLGIARQLRYLINRQPGMRAVLTRQGDYFVDLRGRLKIARKQSADMFISIHADAFINQYSRGASVYALSERGATSEAARWLAEKENYSELGGVNLKALDDTSGMVRSVLIDLSQTATIGSSMDLGGGVLYHMDKMTKLHHRKVEQAPFMVLKSPDIPSILIETGFISNPQEEANLRNPAYQAKLARAILAGIKMYFIKHPPAGSYWIVKK